MFSKIFASLLLSASALAYTTPTSFNVSSNPIFTPSLGQLVPVGKPFKITWGPTESGTVSLVLLRGPAENVQPLYAIAEKIPNSGSYEWTPKSDLVADTTHYGLQLIKDSNGQYQYSVQFGISNPNVVSSSSSSAVATKSSSSSSAEPTTTSYATVQTTVHSSVTSVVYVTSSSSAAPYVTSKPATTLTSTYAPSSRNSTATGTSPTYSNTALPTPSPTGNAASALNVAGGLLMGVAGVAAMLL